jgi:cytoskeletal protein CcmA (bactofilin family)
METQKAPGASTGAPAKKTVAAADDQKLVVGPRIRLQGDVTNCDTLIIEGYFEGSAKSRMIQVARGGTVSGEVEVETAEITGDFNGKLTVSNQLVVHSTGRVTGTVRYFAVEIEAGGQISGDVQVTDEGLTSSAKTGSNVDSDSSEKLEAVS